MFTVASAVGRLEAPVTSFVGAYQNDTCLSVKRMNHTAIGNVYEGIPETLVLNLVSWCLLLALFAILRNRAWDYGRLALVQARDSERWTQLFYKNTDEAVAAEEQLLEREMSVSDVGCSWFPTIFKINRARISARCGPDAAHYLSFQRHLLLVMAIITVLSIVVILPVNFQGTLQGNAYTFAHTTISNLDPTSLWLWTHVFVAFLIVPVTLLTMQRCSYHRRPPTADISMRSVMITHISTQHRNRDDIASYFAVRYPQLELSDVQIAHRVKQLMCVEQERGCAKDARAYCLQSGKHDIRVQPYGCVACCRWRTEPALPYYTRLTEQLTSRVIAERDRALRSPLGIAFVTFRTPADMHMVIDTFQPGTLRHWNIVHSSSPSDINWENLEISTRHWYSKAVVINTLLFVALFFLTTPAIIVNMLNTYTSAQENFIKSFSPVLAEFLPTLLLLLVSALLPVLVGYSSQWMSHWTKSKQNLEVLRKAFFFLLFMVLILPSLGLTSAQAMLDWSLQPANMTLRWECIFLPDKGAFFVNYIITSAFIGTGMELLRFPELAMYAWRLLRVKSKAEIGTIRQEILSIFPFGIHYAWTLLVFTVCTVYSLVCPLITPFGIVYLSLKHLVDKHNIYYVYRPITMTGEGQQIHASAINLVRVPIALLQITMTAFAVVRGGLSYMAYATMMSSAFTVILFFFKGGWTTSVLQSSTIPSAVHSGSGNSDEETTNNGVRGSCRSISSDSQDDTDIAQSHHHAVSEQYVAPVLISSRNLGAIEQSVISSPVYGGVSHIATAAARLSHNVNASPDSTSESPSRGASALNVVFADDYRNAEAGKSSKFESSGSTLALTTDSDSII